MMSRAALALLGRVACKHSVGLGNLESASRHRAGRVGSFRFSLVLLLTGHLGGFVGLDGGLDNNLSKRYINPADSVTPSR
jgi:hypothetical protein